MDYAEALSQIEKLDNGNELVKAIKFRVDGILDEKKSVSRERQQLSDRVSSQESLIEHLTRLAGAEGDNPEDRIKSASSKVQSLTAELENYKKSVSDLEQRATTAENAKTEAEKKAATTQRYLQITDAALAAGANPNVLRMLSGESDISYEVQSGENGKQVVVVQGENKTALTEYAQNNWGDFLPSLFSKTSAPAPTSQQNQQLPSGTPSSTPVARDPVKKQLESGSVIRKKQLANK